MSKLRYAATVVFPLLTAAGIFWGGLWAWVTPAVTFVLVPLLELLIAPDAVNLSEEAEREARSSRFYDLLLYGLVAAQWGLVLAAVLAARGGALAGWDLAGVIASLGICCGAFGINVGHELGHRSRSLDQHMAKAALISSLYVHFFVEHNRGHHARVATEEDPASARRGETLYGFWVRSVRDSLRSAWRLEAERLSRKGISPWSLQNQTLRLLLIQAAVAAGIFAIGGPVGGGVFVASAVIGFLLLETVNYIEHYGLTRERQSDGRYERVRPEHSWNSDHPLGRTLLFELSRHSDHHANPGRPYPVLRHFDQSPQLPTGYPGMILLATLPPLFFRVMDPRVEARPQARAA